MLKFDLDTICGSLGNYSFVNVIFWKFSNFIKKSRLRKNKSGPEIIVSLESPCFLALRLQKQLDRGL